MRNIAEITKDDRKGKELSQTERQIAIAYNQGKYDAVRELKIGNNSNINEVLDKIRVEIEQDAFKDVSGSKFIFVNRVNQIIDKYRGESEDKDKE